MTLLIDQNAQNAATPTQQTALYVPLATRFERDGFEFTQLKRVRDIAIYRQRKNGLTDAFEVVRIQKRKARFTLGREFPAHEFYPPCDQWGERGWTYRTREDAERKFATL